MNSIEQCNQTVRLLREWLHRLLLSSPMDTIARVANPQIMRREEGRRIGIVERRAGADARELRLNRVQ